MSSRRKQKRHPKSDQIAKDILAKDGKPRIPRRTQEGIARRREQVREYLLRGVPKVVMADLLNVSRTTIHEDILEIKRRMGHRVSSTRASGQMIDQEIGMMTSRLESVINAALAEYTMASAGPVKDRFLNTAAKGTWILARLMMETGVLPKAGENITINNRTEVSFKDRFGEENPLSVLDDPVSRRKVLTAIETVLRTSVELGEQPILTVNADEVDTE